MSNQRETLIQSVADLLEEIVLTQYNTNPEVIRGMEHWNDTINLPAIIVDEGEPESIETICFSLKQATIDLVLIGRLRGTWEDANSMQEDMRIIMESSSNTYAEYMNLVSSKVQQDMETDLKEIEMHYAVKYIYDTGAA